MLMTTFLIFFNLFQHISNKSHIMHHLFLKMIVKIGFILLFARFLFFLEVIRDQSQVISRLIVESGRVDGLFLAN